MLKANYGIPVLEDNDTADLNKYSLEMADALKTQLDKFGNPLSYKGQVETIQDLPSDTPNGDIYSVISENKNYIWNGTAWVEYASTIDLTELENKAIVDKTTISGKTSQEGTPSLDNIVPIKNVNVYGVNEFDKDNFNEINCQFNNNMLSTKDTERIIYFKCEKNTTYAFQKLLGTKFQRMFVAETIDLPADGVSYQNNKNMITTGEYIYTTSDTAEYLVFHYYCTGSDLTQQEILDSIKIEKNSIVTPYTPYSYGLLDLNLQKDTDTKTVTLVSKRLHEGDSVDENGFHYENGTLILKGDNTEYWWNYTTGVGGYGITYTHKGLDTLGKCSHYPKDTSEAFTDENAFRVSTNGFNFNVMPTFPTLDEWKAYVAEQYAKGTPITLEYKLKQQENEPFKDTNQTAWNTLEDLLINGYTFIDSSSDELQPIITLIEHTANEIYRENVEKFKELEENIKETILYENTSGSNGDITLNDSIEHYKYLEVIYGRSSDRHYMKIISQKNYVINMSSFSSYLDNSNIMLEQYFAKYQILDETTLQVVLNRCGLVTLKNNTVSGNTNGTNYLKIYRVIGIK